MPKNKAAENTYGGEVIAERRSRSLRATLDAKLKADVPLGPRHPLDTKPCPADLDRDRMTFYPERCISSHTICAAWAQTPMVRFRRQTRPAEAGGLSYRDQLRFSDFCFKRLGLVTGQQFALFSSRDAFYSDDVRRGYFVMQNVLREWDAPAHLHRLGTFTMWPGIGDDDDHRHVLRPETRTHLGVIGNKGYHDYPMSFFEHFRTVTDHVMRLYRMDDDTELVFGLFNETIPVPTDTAGKLTRYEVSPLEDDNHPYDPKVDNLDHMQLLTKLAR